MVCLRHARSVDLIHTGVARVRVSVEMVGGDGVKACVSSCPFVSRRFVVLTVYRIQSWRVNRKSHPASKTSRLRLNVQLEHLLESPSPSVLSGMMLQIVRNRLRVLRCRWRLKITVSTAKPGEECRHHRVLFQSIVLHMFVKGASRGKMVFLTVWNPRHICLYGSLEMVFER